MAITQETSLSRTLLLKVANMIKQKLPKEWNKPDPTELRAEKFLNRAWKFIKKKSIRIIRWVFFYKPENKIMAIYHIIDIIVILYIISRLSKIQ